jgi:hypothetical protein
MKKQILVGIFALFTAVFAHAQWSVMAGLNNVTVKVDVPGFGSASDSELGIFFGGGYEFEVDDKISLEPSVLLSFVSDLSSLYIPVMAEYEVSENVKVVAGPQLNILLEDVEDGATGVDLGLGGEYTFTGGWFAFARFAFQIARGGDFGDFYNINTLTLGVGKKL